MTGRPNRPSQKQFDAMEKAVELIRAKGPMRTADIAEHLACSYAVALRLINRLYSAGRVAGVGHLWKLK